MKELNVIELNTVSRKPPTHTTLPNVGETLAGCCKFPPAAVAGEEF